MSVTTCIKCDGPECSEQLHHDPLLASYPQDWHLPDRWFTLVRGDTQLHTARHFCSPLCLREWAKKSIQQGR